MECTPAEAVPGFAAGIALYYLWVFRGRGHWQTRSSGFAFPWGRFLRAAAVKKVRAPMILMIL